MNGNDEMVSVMVPRRLVTQIYGLIARLDAGLPLELLPPSPPPSVSEANSTSDWTERLLRRMIEESPPAMRDILGLLASRPGESLSAEDLAKSIKAKKDANWNTIAGTLGAFGRRVKNRYKSDQWPFAAKYEHAHRSVRYRMTAPMATRIKKILAETE